jgi:hypothetical protein
MNALKSRMQRLWRKRRMEKFVELMHLTEGAKIIDLGGLPQMITLLNLPGAFERSQGVYQKQYRFIEADACQPLDFADNSFDVVFSNGTIEHVGAPKKQEAFASSIRRLAPSYWIETPAIWFPIEAHCHLPLWWFYPPSLQQAWIRRWQRQGQEFKWKQMSETRVLPLQLPLILYLSRTYD